MNALPCFDYVEIKKAVDDCLIDSAGDAAKNGFVFTQDQHWLKIEDGETIGYIMLVGYNGAFIEFHPFLFKNKRNKSIKAIDAAIGWCWANLPDNYKSLTTRAPSNYRHVHLMCLKFGFKVVGKFQNAFLKNGEHDDFILYQLMRP